MRQPSFRSVFLLGFVICVISMAGALYMQYAEGLNPCPLCVLQRIAYILGGIIFLIGYLHKPQKNGALVSYAVLLFICTLFGIGVALRQVYLQGLPPGEAPACGPGLNYMISHLPLHELLLTILKGTGDCAQVHFRFLTLSLAGWSVVAFSLLNILNLFLLCAPRPKKTPDLKGEING